MLLERKIKQLDKRRIRRTRNIAGKLARAEQRQKALAELGKTVIEVETKDEEGNVTKHYDFPPQPRVRGRSVPSLTFISAKTYKQAAPSRKNRPSFQVEHTEAIVEDASRSLAKAIDEALKSPEPMIPERVNPELLAALSNPNENITGGLDLR